MTREAMRWQKIKSNPELHARIKRQRRMARAERLVGMKQIVERAKWRNWARLATRRKRRQCEGCRAILRLRYVGGQRRVRLAGQERKLWRRLSNRIFCDTCRISREKTLRAGRELRRKIRLALAA